MARWKRGKLERCEGGKVRSGRMRKAGKVGQWVGK